MPIDTSITRADQAVLFQATGKDEPGVMLLEKCAVRSALPAAIQAIMVSVIDQLAEIPRSELVRLTPVGTVEFCRTIMARLGVPEPGHMSYPAALAQYLGRKIRRSRYSDVPTGFFVKPVHGVKSFTGHLKGSWPEGEVVPAGLDRAEVWWSAPMRFTSEFRFYIVRDQIAGWSQYGDGDDAWPDQAMVARAVEAMSVASAPDGYALDFGLLEDGRQLLVEANDGWALGLYRDGRGGMSAKSYLDLIAARWRQIIGGSGICLPQISA